MKISKTTFIFFIVFIGLRNFFDEIIRIFQDSNYILFGSLRKGFENYKSNLPFSENYFSIEGIFGFNFILYYLTPFLIFGGLFLYIKYDKKGLLLASLCLDFLRIFYFLNRHFLNFSFPIERKNSILLPILDFILLLKTVLIIFSVKYIFMNLKITCLKERQTNLNRLLGHIIDQYILTTFSVTINYALKQSYIIYSHTSINDAPTFITQFSKNQLFLIIYFIIFVLYYSFSEAIFKSTFGKLIFGGIVMNEDNSLIDFKSVLLRTIGRLIPFDTLSFLGNRGWHDKLGKSFIIKL